MRHAYHEVPLSCRQLFQFPARRFAWGFGLSRVCQGHAIELEKGGAKDIS